MSERISPTVAALAAIAMAVLVPDATARADVLGCDDTDRRCIDDLFSASCAERGSTRETCEALAREAEAAWSTTQATTTGELLGLVYYRLAEGTDDEQIERSYREGARAVYLSIVDADEESLAAYQMLSVLDSKDPDQHVAWLRKAVAIQPDSKQIQFLINALLSQGTEEAYIEALDLLQDQYDAAPPGIAKWQWASSIHNLLSFGALRYDFTVDPGAAAAWRSRVSRESDWDGILATLSSPSAHAEDVATALETACQLTIFFGYEPCLDGIERTVLAARTQSERNAQLLADAAAHGIRTAPSGGIVVDEELLAARRQMARWLTGFAELGLDSVAVLETIGRMPEAADRWIEVRQEIVRREPNDGDARFQLGKVYYDRSRWVEAIPELELARELLPEDERYLIDSYLRQARYERDAAR